MFEKNSEKWIHLIQSENFDLVKENSSYLSDVYLKTNEDKVKVKFTDLNNLFIYFIETTPFNFKIYLDFFKKMDAIYLTVFNYSECMVIFAEKVIFPNYFFEKDYERIVKPNLNLTIQDKENLKLFLYCIRCTAYHKKYNSDVSYFLEYLKQLDQSLYQELITHSNAELDIEVIETSNEHFIATSNNVLASIEIIVFEYKIESYKAVLNYINQLFEQGFPKNHRLNFEVKDILEQDKLGISQLIDCGGNRFFNSAAGFHDLHEDIFKYIKILGREYRYTDLGENGRFLFEVISFAIYGLVLEDLKYVDVFKDFLKDINIYESYNQNCMPTALLDRHGITNKSVRAYLEMFEVLLQNENFYYEFEDFFTYFNNIASMEILLEEIKKYNNEKPDTLSSQEIMLCLLGQHSYGYIEDWMHDKYAIMSLKSPQMIALYRELNL